MKFVILKIFIFLKVVSILSAQNYRAQFKTVCGQPRTGGRIVGGTDAMLGEFPWIARTGVKKFRNPEFHCAGAVITDRHVLSASHCFYDIIKKNLVNSVIVSLGDHDEKGRKSCIGKQCADLPVIYDVEKLYAHNLDETSFKEDISVLKLKLKIKFTRWIAPICLPDNMSPTTMIGQSMITMGFGLIDSRKRKLPSVLQKTTVFVKPLEDCDIFMESPGFGQICAGHPDRDSCDGDSGGPLVKLVKSAGGPKYLLFGIVSYGAELCENTSPAVYTDVNYFIDWIDEKVDL